MATISRQYTETEIAEAMTDYAERHDLTEVDVCRNYEGDDGPVIGFRLSPADGTTCAGIDETVGKWR